ncbi:LysM peptidoglycan-binding domain-containing protein [Desulfuribacillus alkaliarsenatis]|uniref:LysM domain-containing protein n=1 Tax=Desulfuribacillus alkaliarsenatis TaxID=766136 RepID=A0A1E5G140_9FIRM|nr:LysM peptidoglycan-binding domain-containing protein [Desulfuribacillus alkaliarsenatis]OEF96625.1 hypothetical protein BHF68_08260 [Desulfuribacillus alkaliarsenatis]
MSTLQPRIPTQCPPGFLGRYTVSAGESMYIISQMFRVRLEALVANNPHITDPNLIYPGDVLCVPGRVPYPACKILRPRVGLPFRTTGIAFIGLAPRGGQSVSFMATLPEPQTFGNYDIYIGEIYIPSINGFGTEIFATPEDPPTWSGRVEIPLVAEILPESLAVIRPANSITGISGSIILSASF